MATEWDDVLVRAGFAPAEGEQRWEDLALPDSFDLEAVVDELTSVPADLADMADDDVLFGPRARRTTAPDPADDASEPDEATDEEGGGPDTSTDDASADVDPALDPLLPAIELIEPETSATVDPWALDEDELPEDEDSIDLELSEIELPNEP